MIIFRGIRATDGQLFISKQKSFRVGNKQKNTGKIVSVIAINLFLVFSARNQFLLPLRGLRRDEFRERNYVLADR